MPPILLNKVDLTAKPSNKKIVFDDDGEILPAEATATKKTKQKKLRKHADLDVVKTVDDDNAAELDGADNEEDYFAKRDRQRLEQKQNDGKNNDDHKKWFNVYPQFPSSEEDILEMKENEQMELYNLCKSSFEAELPAFIKRNTSDARWLQTALQKGTAKDRANAGALLVTSNSLGNLEALGTLIGFTKLSNKCSSDVMGILTDLWKEVLLPPHRKLISLQQRGVDWKQVRKDTNLTKEQQRRIFAFWHFENELKEQYFEFLKNLQQGIQTGQENNKNASIVSAAHLLAFAPEKEQMLLNMLINKLGDPIPKIASKTLHHLSEVAQKHPNMCGVIVAETEKFIFRNNISERAQHFALCFLASVAPSGRPEVCSKLVHICFSLFKVLVQKGAVNNRTMQAILRCLQKAILEAQPPKGETEILNKEMQDTIYRLVHMADIRISVQTLGLLLQLLTVKTEKSDRFYNALYRKLLDTELSTIGVKTAAQLLHIVHRAIHIDANVKRAQAFIKRLLHVSLYMPQHMTAGCLIVIDKLSRSRKELTANVGSGISAADSANGERVEVLPKVTADDEELAKFDSDGEEKYIDIQTDDECKTTDISDSKLKSENKQVVASSWHHAKVEANVDDNKVRDIAASKYDPFHRVPTFAGAEFALWNELLLLRKHVHPTVQVFASNIAIHKRIKYYGDPLRDFGLPHFLERFAFKNPKKLDNQKAEAPIIAHKRYISFGTRGKPVKSLTKANCTEDEMFILNFLEEKRKQSAAVKKYKKDTQEEDEDNLGLKEGEIDDNEFEQYLDGFFGKKAKTSEDAEEDDDAEELDFLKELGGELKDNTKQKKIKKHAIEDDEDNVEDIDADWGDDEEVNDNDFAGANSDLSEDEEGSIDNDDDDDDDGGSISLDENMEDEYSDEDVSEQDSSNDENDSDEDVDMAPPKSKKSRTGKEMSFAKKLKHSDDMSSLFAAADDFAELLEETSKSKGQGTINAVYNKDKSSEKQIKWEEKRRSNTKTYTKKKAGRFGGAKGGCSDSSKVYGKKRKH